LDGGKLTGKCKHFRKRKEVNAMSLRQAMDRLFEESFVRPTPFLGLIGEGTLPIEMYQTADQVVVKAALSGMKHVEVDITITGDTLAIKGEAKAEEEVKRKDQLLLRFWSGDLGEVGFESLLKPACVTCSL